MGLERGKGGEVVPKFLSTIIQSAVAPNSELIYWGVGDKRVHNTLYYIIRVHTILHYMLIMQHSCFQQLYFSCTAYHLGNFIQR